MMTVTPQHLDDDHEVIWLRPRCPNSSWRRGNVDDEADSIAAFVSEKGIEINKLDIKWLYAYRGFMEDSKRPLRHGCRTMSLRQRWSPDLRKGSRDTIKGSPCRNQRSKCNGRPSL